jgi:transcriptional regulator with XRE-family HTH domain
MKADMLGSPAVTRLTSMLYLLPYLRVLSAPESGPQSRRGPGEYSPEPPGRLRLQLQALRCKTCAMSPVTVSAIGAYIRDQREQAKISLRQLAQSAGISNPYLSQIERGLRRPSADILQQIAKGLRISAEALYVQAGFLEDRPPGSLVREAVLTDPELTERQKQMLVEVYESFRKETAMARAEAGEIVDDQSGLAPDEAALTWPENLSPAALAGRPRRLAIAPNSPSDADTDDSSAPDEAEDGDDAWLDADEIGPAGLADSPWHAPDDSDPRRGGTIHQFPPPPTSG